MAIPVIHAGSQPLFKILTVDPGMHRVYFEDLVKAGFEQPTLNSDTLALTFLGKDVALLVSDGDDGQFGPGDHFEFRARSLRGDLGYYHEYTQTSAYFLLEDVDRAVRFQNGASVPVANQLLPSYGQGPALRSKLHLETDTLLMRFRAIRNQPHEIWYWHKLACNDKQPFEIPIHTPDLHRQQGGKVHLTLGMRGWSRFARNKKIPDHLLRVLLNDEVIHETEWSGKGIHEIKILDLPAKQWRAGQNKLELMIPSRHDDQGQLIVDVTLLNWIELDYPKSPVILEQQNSAFEIAPAFLGQPFHLIAPSSKTVFLYSDQHTRWQLTPPNPTDNPVTIYHLPSSASQTGFYALAEDGFQKPRAVIPYQANDLLEPSQSIDYIMISHPSLLEASAPLANFHRQQGLTVKQVDIRDVYDSFNHGILHPKAIQKFLAHAYHHWPKPAPRFVLLVGDASWDTKNATVKDENYPDLTYYPRFRTEFNKILSTAYLDAKTNNRNYIPTLTFFDGSGHSASDNGLVCLDGDDIRPDMAIGRLPVTQPQEVTAIVDKTIEYMNAPQVGPWRRNILYITNEEVRFQSQTTKIATQMAETGMVTQRIYPDSKEKSNEKHTQVILDALNHGQYLVYFLGHGGRYIWRTGPPDFRKNHDLFTLDDLDKLQTNRKLPIIVSLTCFSAPFDHPGADSIGEKFLRLSEKGSVAFYGASWRNWPNAHMARETMRALTQESTLGEAIQQSKQAVNSKTLVETYNLLGDPALPLRKPPNQLDIQLQANSGGLVIEVEKSLIGGEGILDLLNEVGEPLRTIEFKLDRPTLQLDLPASEAQPQSVQIYLWHLDNKRDALGRLVLSPPDQTAQKGKPSQP